MLNLLETLNLLRGWKIFLSYLIAMPMAFISFSSMETNAQVIEEIVVSATKRDESLQM